MELKRTNNPEEFQHFYDAVTIRNAWKTYSNGKHKLCALKNFEMTVKEGTIYALVGASGCGKTTLLNCIVNEQKLDFGTILIYGHKPGSKQSGVPGPTVGYMPQGLSMYMDLSIHEIMIYFGMLYGMTPNDIKLRMEYLTELMQLPPDRKIIHSLSGGQQRRVSFTLAMLHQPKLLILDEPTVGVDPILRKSIWSHLRRLSSSTKTTVILTTHYIEEARHSQMMGVMRDGHLLAQESPASLLRMLAATTLEEVVSRLCRLDEQGSLKQNQQKNSNHVCSSGHDASVACTSSEVSFVGGVAATLYKDFVRIRRNLVSVQKYAL